MNLRLLREEKNLSQSGLARQMADAGHPWHQSTVYRIEQGKQTASYPEAKDLARILQTSMERFSWTGPEANATEYVYAAGTRLKLQYEAVADAVKMLIIAGSTAERVAASMKDSEYEHVREAVADVEARLGECTLDNAVNAGIDRYEEMYEDAAGDEEGPDDAAQSES